MSVEIHAWVFRLKGVSPIARLLAIYAAEAGGSRFGVADVDIGGCLEWIGCDRDQLIAAIDELCASGVIVRSSAPRLVLRFGHVSLPIPTPEVYR